MKRWVNLPKENEILKKVILILYVVESISAQTAIY